MKRPPSGLVPVIAIDRASAKALHRQLYEGYREAIIGRRLRAGQRLPSTRALASELAISRITVLTAFEQLLAEGYIESHVGAGSFVARSLPADLGASASPLGARRAGRRVVARGAEPLLRRAPMPWLEGWGAFRVSQTAVEHFPIKTWSAIVARHCRASRASLMRYGDALGERGFREAVAGYLRTARGVRCEADEIMVVSGSQQALEITARVLLDPGNQAWVEDPGYSGARDALTMVGARLAPVPVDREGLDVGGGMRRWPRARVAYVTPSHQYPLGATMSASRRLQLLEWAQATGAWIIEDDYDSEFRYDSQPIAALQGLDRDSRVVYIGTLSKVLFPALRLGYIVMPSDLVQRFVTIREAMDIFPPTLYQSVLTDFIGEGHFARHIHRMRLMYRDRRTALVDAIHEELDGALRSVGDPAGMHLVATFDQGADDRELSARAARAHLWVMPLSACYLGRVSRRGFVLGYGGTDVREIRTGVRRLRELFGGAVRIASRAAG